jgi:hypothetical protein
MGMRPLLQLAAFGSGWICAAALAQPIGPGAPSPELQMACAAAQAAESGNARALAVRAQCVLAGVAPSTRPFEQARELARESLRLGDPAGGFMLYVAFASDPANTHVRDGKPDLGAYRRLAGRTLDERKDQAEALDALAFAAGKGHVNAGLALATYFYETNAPQNVARTRAMSGLLLKAGERNPVLEKLLREAGTVEKTAPTTKASVRSFLDAYRPAVGTALAGYRVQKPGTECAKAELKSVSSGDIEGAEYLPLAATMVARSYLVRGQWSEFWTFDACGEAVPVKVTFQADGWGGSTFTTVHNR